MNAIPLIFGTIICSISLCYAGIGRYEKFQLAFKELFKNESMVQLWKEHVRKFQEPQQQERKRVSDFYQGFSCHTQSPLNHQRPTSVHQLTPWDINVVAAMGDSLTAGNGISATNWIGVLVEFRGKSWSIGGDGSLDTGVVTVPNIIKKFNPNVKGYSIKSGDRSSPDSGLNVADPGHTSHDMPDQARLLVQKLKADTSINFLHDWKLITLFIGGNDLCDYCNDKVKYSPRNYHDNIQQALDILHAEVPKAFVNLVEIFDITPVAALSHGFFCSLVTSYACACGKNDNELHELQYTSKAYQAELETLVYSGRYDTRDDFTVVLQPFFRDTVPPNTVGTASPDLTYFSPDCFHFSAKGQAAAAHSLWNNMLEPVSRKDTSWYINTPTMCPTNVADKSHPYFSTYKNM